MLQIQQNLRVRFQSIWSGRYLEQLSVQALITSPPELPDGYDLCVWSPALTRLQPCVQELVSNGHFQILPLKNRCREFILSPKRHEKVGLGPRLRFNKLLNAFSPPCYYRNNCTPGTLFTADVQRFCPDNFIPIKVLVP